MERVRVVLCCGRNQGLITKPWLSCLCHIYHHGRCCVISDSQSSEDLGIFALRGVPPVSGVRSAQGDEPLSCGGGCGRQDTDSEQPLFAYVDTSNCENYEYEWDTKDQSESCFLPQDEELHRTCNESTKLQAAYGHYFDLSIVNDNLDETYRTVKVALETVSKNPQWVPVTWVF